MNSNNGIKIEEKAMEISELCAITKCEDCPMSPKKKTGDCLLADSHLPSYWKVLNTKDDES